MLIAEEISISVIEEGNSNNQNDRISTKIEGSNINNYFE